MAPGLFLLGDSLYSSFAVIVKAQSLGCHVVAEFRKMCTWRLHSKSMDQIIRIEKPRKKPGYVSSSEFRNWPDQIEVRIVKLRCAPKGFRVRTKYILTTHLRDEVTPSEILELYRKRWQIELNFRSIKIELGMDVLRGKTPAMVCREIWIHMLAYNMIRVEMLRAAIAGKVLPSEISFRATQQLMCVYRLVSSCNPHGARNLWSDLTEHISKQHVGKRPNRYEPRAIKRRKKNFTLLSEDRKAAKRRLYKKQRAGASS